MEEMKLEMGCELGVKVGGERSCGGKGCVGGEIRKGLVWEGEGCMGGEQF